MQIFSREGHYQEREGGGDGRRWPGPRERDDVDVVGEGGGDA